MKPIVEYTDYRACLADWLGQRRESGLPVSNRWFALKMGVNSSSWLTSLLHGKKNLSKESANRLSGLMKHDAFETRYFETLVFFNQARGLDERNRYWAELALLQKSQAVRTVDAGQYDFYTCWYHSAVRSHIGMHGFCGDFARLGAALNPTITASQARKSIELLERLGLILKNQQGNYELTSPAITTGDEVKSLAVANFHRETIRLAEESFDRHPAADRDIRTLTLGISQSTVQQIKEILAESRRKIVELANADQQADRVFQLNMQLFPLSNDTEKGRGGKP